MIATLLWINHQMEYHCREQSNRWCIESATKSKKTAVFCASYSGVFWNMRHNNEVRGQKLHESSQSGYYREWCNPLAICRQKWEFLNPKWLFQRYNDIMAAYKLVHQYHHCHMKWQTTQLTCAVVWILDRQLPRKHQNTCSHAFFFQIWDNMIQMQYKNFRNGNWWLRCGSGERRPSELKSGKSMLKWWKRLKALWLSKGRNNGI